MSKVRDSIPYTPKVLDKVFGTSQLKILDSLKNIQVSTREGFRLQIFESSSADEANRVLKIFNKSFILDEFASFSKILILSSSFFVLIMSKKYIQDIKNDKFEYPIITLLSILGMFFMVSANDLILFYSL